MSDPTPREPAAESDLPADAVYEPDELPEAGAPPTPPTDFAGEPDESIADGLLKRVHPNFYKVQLIASWIFSVVVVISLGVVSLLAWQLEWFPEPWPVIVLGLWPLLSVLVCWFDHVYPRYDQQIELAPVDKIVAAWSAS